MNAAAPIAGNLKLLPVAVVLAFCVRSAAGAAALTPMEPGFRQTLHCNGGNIEIALETKRNPLAPRVTVVTTTLSVGGAKIVTNALRTMDAQGNIYALGYALPGFVKTFRKMLLLPASPPAAGSVTSYYNVGEVLAYKRR